MSSTESMVGLEKCIGCYAMAAIICLILGVLFLVVSFIQDKLNKRKTK